jgi:hypothetical protein
MKLVPTILLATSLLLVGISAAPAASADTCVVADPTLDAAVCGAYSVAWCVVGNTAPKPDLVGLVTCDVVLLN